MRYILPLKYIDAVSKTKSIRAAAENLAITPSALNRRILSIEQELGVAIFERSAQGVRLNSAGEIFILHARTQITDLEKVRSRIADLKGLRSGHVKIAATNEVCEFLLPKEIYNYRMQFPEVTFEVSVMSAANAANALLEHSVDVIFTYSTSLLTEFHTLINIPQRLHCLLSTKNPLAKRKTLGLMECLQQKLHLQPRGNNIREILEIATKNKGLSISPSIESDSMDILKYSVKKEDGILFTIPVAIESKIDTPDLIAVPIDNKDLPIGSIQVSQLRLRTLPVATAKFVEELRKTIDS